MNKFKLYPVLQSDVSILILTVALLPGWCVAATTVVSGFSEVPKDPESLMSDSEPGVPGGDTGDLLLDGFSFNAALSGIYDSNIDQDAAPQGKSEKDDFIVGLGGGVNYLSKSTGWTFGGNYKGNYDQYLSYTDYSAYDQSGGVVVNYEGGRVSGKFDGGISYDEGTNRDYDSSFVKMTTYSAGLSARYRISSKTTIEGNLRQKFTSTADDTYSNTEEFDVGASALWRYSPLTEFGPGLRYTYRAADGSAAERTTIGPILNLNYKLTTKVDLISRAGVEFASYEDGEDSDPFFGTSVTLKYQASKLWNMRLSLDRDTEADPTEAGAFTEKTSLSLAYSRKLRRAILGLGVSYVVNDQGFSDSSSSPAEDDRDYFKISSSLGMMVFSSTTMASIFLQYSEESSDTTDSWDVIQTGFSLSRNF